MGTVGFRHLNPTYNCL